MQEGGLGNAKRANVHLPVSILAAGSEPMSCRGAPGATPCGPIPHPLRPLISSHCYLESLSTLPCACQNFS